MKLLGVGLLLLMVSVLLAAIYQIVVDWYAEREERASLINWLAHQGLLKKGR